jgi:hypothetical protein
MKITFKKVAIGVLTGLGLYAGYRALNRKAASTQVPIETLISKIWKTGNASWPGSKLRLSYNTDGTINFGDGYRGKVLNENTIVTNERNGKPEAPITWIAQGVSGVGNIAMPTLLS